MFYGFGISPYAKMMMMRGQTPGIIAQPEEEEEKRRGWRDLFLPKQYGGSEVPDDVAQKARARGLGALGIALLEGASTNDWGGSLARGMIGMRESVDSDLERNRRMGMEQAEEERRKAAEARAEAQEADRARRAPIELESAQVGLDAGKEELEAFRRRQQEGKDLRARTGKSAQQMVDEINALAAANPEDEKLQAMAKRAVGYSLGDDSDLNSLAKLHDDMTAQAYRDEDAKWRTEAEIKAEREKAAEGFGEIASGRRADRSIAIQEQYAARGSSSSSDTVRPATWYDDVNKEIDALIKPWMESRMRRVGEVDTEAIQSGATGTPRIQAPSVAEINAKRLEVESLAVSNVDRRYGTYGEGGGQQAPAAEPGQALHARNQAVEGLLRGGSEQEALAILKRLGALNGYSPEQILEEAKIQARRRGWRG